MKKESFILTSAFAFIAISLFGQTHNGFRNEDYDVKKFRIINIKVLPPQKHLSLHNINAVFVVDARPDTVPIGFMQKHPLNHAFIELNKSVRQETEDFINDYFQFRKNDSPRVLVMVLKKMWLTDELDIQNDYLNDKIKDRKKEYTSGIKIKAEFYYKNDNDYYPLYRYDSVLRDSFNVTQNAPYYIHDAIVSSLSKLSNIDGMLDNIGSKRKLSWEEIRQHNDEAFNIPILKDTNLQRGVYISFDEFKNNNPSEKNFEVRTDKMNDILYIKQQDGKEFVMRNDWGYCDGHKIFIRSVDNFFELQRLGNAYYIYGAKNINRAHPALGVEKTDPWISPSLPNAPSAVLSQINHRHFKLILEPLQLDWDSGKLD